MTDYRDRLPSRTAKGGWLHDHALTLVLAALFLSSWIGQLVSQVVQVRNEAEEHGQQFTWSDFWPQFLSSTFENWQSEFLQLFSFVVLTALLIHRDSAESADGDDEMKAMLEELLDRVPERTTAPDATGVPPA